MTNNAADVSPLAGRIALGGAGFSITDERDEQVAVAAIIAAYDAGIRIFDTARAYATVDDPLHNEKLFAQALAGRPDAFIMTKGGHFRTGRRSWDVDNSPARLRQDIDDSLRALRTERLDLFFVHRADSDLAGEARIAESIGALESLRLAGKLGAIGLSNVTAEQLSAAQDIAPIAAVQNRHTIGVDDDAMMQRCADDGIAFFAYSPLGGPGGATGLSARFPRIAELAASRGASVQRLLLRAILAMSPAASVVVGAGRPATAIDTAAAAAEQWDVAAATALASDLAGHHEPASA